MSKSDRQRFVVVAYDIPDDRRRQRLHDALLDFGTPVQYSVFECLVDSQEYGRLRRRVRSIIRPRLDHVRFYQLCATCQGKVETTAGPEVSQEASSWVV